MGQNRVRLFAAVLFVTAAATEPSLARSFRPSQYPNGTVIGCAACHINPAGGGTRTPFGNRVYQIIGGSSSAVPFWSPMLAAEDSDGDGYCNGQEVGDPDGDGTPIPGAAVSNPGVATSTQVNSRAVFVSTPVTQATLGSLYQYQAAAADPDTCQRLTFTKLAGPSWLTVSTNGLVSGTPTDEAPSSAEVTVRVTDNGSPAQANTQTYTLSVVSTFAAWQQLNFNLPAEASLAGPESDPDGDGIPNLVEYGRRSNPRAANAPAPVATAFDAGQRMVASVSLRDNDPKLNARMEAADTLSFAGASVLSGVVTDPSPNDGLKTWAFQDTVARTNVAARFGRILLELLP